MTTLKGIGRLCSFCLGMGVCSGQVVAQAQAQCQLPNAQGAIIFIYTGAALASIGQQPGFPLDGIYQLANDIDLAGVLLRPIGTGENPFQGKLYGEGYAITHLHIQGRGDNTGLFGVMGEGALVQEVFIKEGQVQGNARTGLLVGWNRGEVRNCYVMGWVAGTDNVGGLVGMNDRGGRICNTQAVCQVTGQEYEVGGLVGCNLGYVIDSHVQVAVAGKRLVGGLVGTNDETGQLMHCTALGKVTGQYWVGGLVGHNWFRGQVSHCIAMAAVVGEAYVGGLVGFNYAQARIMRSSSAGTVKGARHTGLMVGGNRGSITYGLSAQDKWSDRPQKPFIPWSISTLKGKLDTAHPGYLGCQDT